jgi:hypothetical protein
LTLAGSAFINNQNVMDIFEQAPLQGTLDDKDPLVIKCNSGAKITDEKFALRRAKLQLLSWLQ